MRSRNKNKTKAGAAAKSRVTKKAGGKKTALPKTGDPTGRESRALREEDTAHEEFASKPGGFTLWLRQSFVWQLVRFVVINVRMLAMISKAQPKRIR